MRKGIMKAVILAVIFFAAVMIFSFMTNQTNKDLTTEMQEAVLPTLTLYDGQMPINELYGYTAEMDAQYMRDTITPIPKNRMLLGAVSVNQMNVERISYEIRSLDAKRLIANADAAFEEAVNGVIDVQFVIQNLLESGEEYLLVIQLWNGDDAVSYYTRIMEADGYYVTECVEFVKQFNDATFESDGAETLRTYLETASGNNTTLQYVTLNNSLKQISWGEFAGTRVTSPVPSIKEITPTYNVIVLCYVMERTAENGRSEYYNVEEYYRVRYTSTRMYLLNFERTMEEIFSGTQECLRDDGILLGIRSSEVEYQVNETGKTAAFVQQGELWSYNQDSNTLAKVFSFRGSDGIDLRENYGEHDIKIVNIDEAGSIDYIVYGYMNRGIHEGKVGIAVYHYDSPANTNEEQVFIPSAQSYEVMKSELGQLMYVTEAGNFYIMVDGVVYGIDLNTLETKIIVEGLSDEAVAISESNRFLAWVDPDAVRASHVIHIIDFVTEKVIDISEGENDYLKPLGFMQEDFVYGAARADDVVVDAAGNTLFPMYQVKIMDTESENQDILKTYEKEGYYVEGISINGSIIYLNRIQNNGMAYVDASQDMIMNREGNSHKFVDITQINIDEKQTQTVLTLQDMTNKKNPKLLTPKETILEETREVALEERESPGRYYVYVKGNVVLTTESVSEAIITANEKMGVVIGDNQQYVWKRSRKTVQTPFSDISTIEADGSMGSIALCINALLEREGIHIAVGELLSQGQTPKQILTDTLKDAVVLDLTGCTVDEILYYVSNGSPVFAMTGSRDAVLVIGYDSSSVTLYDPAALDFYKKTIAEADALFFEAGSVFFTYQK